MKKLINFAIFVACALLLLAGCVGLERPVQESGSPPPPDTPLEPDPAQSKAEYIRITSEEAQPMMTDDVVILDVRTQEEYDGGHIRSAILLPYEEIARKAESILADKDQTILVYCRSGRRSEIAARALIDMGFTNVIDFGGILDWHGEIVK